MSPYAQLAEMTGVDAARLRTEIMPAARPVILRGIVAHWPVVKAAQVSDEAVVACLKGYDNGRPASVFAAPPEAGGKLFYSPDMAGVNFKRLQVPISSALERLMGLRADASPETVSVQSTPIPEHLPGFVEAHAFDLLPATTVPRIWIGNALTTRTHYDLSHNIACVVAGRRRFILFPPDQLANLYSGPFENTLSGPPVSMIDPEDPDFERFPRFAEAQTHGLEGQLGPGDALYIPYGWWHHVRSLSPFNALVNYWWNESPYPMGSPYYALFHAELALKAMTDEERRVWREIFDVFVFRADGAPLEHLSPKDRGIFGDLSPADMQMMKQRLLKGLGQ